MLQWFCVGWIVGIAGMGTTFWNPHLAMGWIILLFMIWQLIQPVLFNRPERIPLKGLQLFANLMLGLLLGFSYANIQLDERLAFIEQDSRQGEFIVYVPQISQLKQQRIQQKVEVLSPNKAIQYFMVYWPRSSEQYPDGSPEPIPGQYYRIKGQIKPSQSYVTSGAFDQEKWNLQQNIHANLSAKEVEQLTAQQIYTLGFTQQYQIHQSWLHQLNIQIELKRLALREFIKQQPLRNTGLLLALLTGDKSLLNHGTSQLFQRFGMSHLLAISGPHVLVFAMMACWWVKRMTRKFWPNLYLKWPEQYVLIPPFLICVLAYCAFTGFEIPALRTLIICMVACTMLILQQPIRALQLLLFSAALLLLFDPFSILSAAFWLSYGACFILLRIYQSLKSPKNDGLNLNSWQKLKSTLKILVESQWKIFVALFPLMIIFFKQIAWITPLSNLFAIPWLGLVVVPLDILAALCTFISDPLAAMIFQLNDWCLEALYLFLYGLDRIFSAQMQDIALNPWQLGLLILAIFIFFLPHGVVPRLWTAIALIAVIIPFKPQHAFQLSVLDVGQGQSIYIQYKQHNMMVDFGGNYDETQFSIGQNIIRPFLSLQGVHRLEQVVLTHLDQDHSGGFFSLERQLAIGQLYSNAQVNTLNPAPQRYCQRGHRWNWENKIFFEFLSPSPQQLHLAALNANESSCVLHVSVPEATGFKNYVLMGDAGWETEYQILQHYPNLKVDVLVLGHHGSRHSSAYAFLKQLQPKLAVASAGRFNRYGHPAALTQARLQQLGIPLLQTASSGSIHFIQQDQNIEVTEERMKYKWLFRQQE